MVSELASHRHCMERICANWSTFVERRRQRLMQQERYGVAAEKVAENILEDLFTIVLDWPLSDINNQIGYADLLLTSLGIKYLIVEVKRPGALAWNRRAVEAALDQAHRYADEQKVRCIGVSDGVMLYAADIEHGGLQDRAYVSLESSEPPEALWWISRHGIYRSRKDAADAVLRLLPETVCEITVAPESAEDVLLHPKYGLPAHCFGYVGDASDPGTWKLPYLRADGTADTKRLPKAIGSILSNYRGLRVSGIPEQDIPEVLVRLGCAAASVGKLPGQTGKTSATYQQLAEVLEQLGRLDEVVNSA